MADLLDGQTFEVKGSGAKPYVLTNTGGVYSCTCPAWRNQSAPIDRRTCKHLRALRGTDAERVRVEGSGSQTPPPAPDGPDARPAAALQMPKAPPLLLAHSWTPDVDPTGWWMSEKLDGVRAYWDGRRFLSRLGNEYRAPSWFTEGLPSFPLDGELWGGRKNFQRTVSIVRRQDAGEDWREIGFVVFDAPRDGGSFETRLAAVRGTKLEYRARFAWVHEQVCCESALHLSAELARVERMGGEGLMLRQAGSHYEAGRSRTLLKVKSFKDDEARVVAHVPGAGKHKGRLGALAVEMGGGVCFNIGTGFSDAERRTPPSIGSVVTFRYQELTEGGVPRFPSYVGVREDVRVEASR